MRRFAFLPFTATEKKRKSSLVRQSIKALSLFFSSLITRRVCTLQPMQNERTGSLFKRGNSQYGGGGKQPAEVTIPNISRNTEKQLHSTLPAAIYNPCTPFVVAVEGDKEGEESKHLVVERERLSWEIFAASHRMQYDNSSRPLPPQSVTHAAHYQWGEEEEYEVQKKEGEYISKSGGRVNRCMWGSRKNV